MSEILLNEIPLGKVSPYISTYAPSLLCPLPRADKRIEIGVCDPLPFEGVDIWNAYELSWLDEATHKPRVAMSEFYFPCRSEKFIESKSLKLYLHSLNQTTFKSESDLKHILQNDLSKAVGAKVRVQLMLPPFCPVYPHQDFYGYCLDDLTVNITKFLPDPSLLSLDVGNAEETLFSNLLKSNCPVTNQPDWASILICYEGQKINHIGLLQYIISFRNYVGFHENCVELIFMDILRECKPSKLTVYARYTRRGGLDISPFRSNFQSTVLNIRNIRQ